MHNESDFTDPPDRRVGGLALFRNEVGAVLLVEKKYRTGLARWGLVGGSANPGEPAAIACQRQILEETGLKIVPERLLVVHYMPAQHPVREGFNFIFDGGVLPADTDITLPEDELASYGWAALDELPGLVPPYTGWRITCALNTSPAGPSANSSATRRRTGTAWPPEPDGARLQQGLVLLREQWSTMRRIASRGV